jgi:hypothetical protein
VEDVELVEADGGGLGEETVQMMFVVVVVIKTVGELMNVKLSEYQEVVVEARRNVMELVALMKVLTAGLLLVE